MQTARFEYNGRTYLASRLNGFSGRWSFTAHGETIEHMSDMDLINEFGECDAAWCQYIDDVMLNLDLIRVDDNDEYAPTREMRIQVYGLGHPDNHKAW